MKYKGSGNGRGKGSEGGNLSAERGEKEVACQHRNLSKGRAEECPDRGLIRIRAKEGVDGVCGGRGKMWFDNRLPLKPKKYQNASIDGIKLKEPGSRRRPGYFRVRRWGRGKGGLDRGGQGARGTVWVFKRAGSK